jgi:hypothetical protein
MLLALYQQKWLPDIALEAVRTDPTRMRRAS